MFRKVLGIILISFMVCMSAFAGGVGNCIQPLKSTNDVGFGGGFEYNYVANRLNDLDNRDSSASDMRVENAHQIYGKILFGFFEDFNLYAKIGGTDYSLKFNEREGQNEIVVDLETGIYTGGGVNILYQITEVGEMDNPVFVGFDFQVNYSHNNVAGLSRGGQDANSVSGSFYKIDGMNSVYFAMKYELEDISTSFVPYVGAYHSWIVLGSMESLTYQTPTGGYLDNRDYQANYDLTGFGVLLGIDVEVAKYININVEGRLIGENAVTAGAVIKF